MPSRKHRYDAIRIREPWVDELEDRCLREIVLQAFESRRHVVDTKGDKKLLAIGDQALEQIEFGRVKGEKAWRTATTALRRFDEAWLGFSTAWNEEGVMSLFNRLVSAWRAYRRSWEASLSWDHPERSALPTGTYSAQGHSQWIVKDGG